MCREVLEADVAANGAYYGIVCSAGVTRDAAFPALTDDAMTLTYAELARETGTIAASLSGRDASAGDVVAIVMSRSLDAVVLTNSGTESV